MPQIVVSYSENLLPLFDRRAFALAVHREAAEVIDAAPDDYKTRFLPISTWVIGDGEGPDTLVHVEFGLLSGRNEEARAELATRLLAVAREAVPEAPARTHFTVEVREMDRPVFAKHITA